jgi:hypothetical protein
LHRKQQQAERQFAAKQILEAQTMVDEDTLQPQKAHILIDAWTSSQGDSPKVLKIRCS